MPESRSATLTLLDDRGKSIGQIVICPRDDRPDSMLTLPGTDADLLGEEPIQLMEGHSYEYRLDLLRDDLDLRESTVVTRSKMSTHQGTIAPGPYTGRLPLIIESPDGTAQGRAALEVRSTKLDYRKDYRQMIDFITEQCTELLLQIRAPSQARLTSRLLRDPLTAAQRFAFVQSLLSSPEFREALERIESLPNVATETRHAEQDFRRGARVARSTLTQIASGQPRLALPTPHPLSCRIRSVPEKITVTELVETVDTPENRFVLHVLETFADFLSSLESTLRGLRHDAYSRLKTDVSHLLHQIAGNISHPFFRGVSRLRILPLSSPVLQRKEGYREILRAWLKFNLAAQLVWSGGEDVYGSGKRDVATLYEYWVFFRLIGIAGQLFHLSVPPAMELIEKTDDGMGLKLKSGRALSFTGEYLSAARRPLSVRFCYNRSFLRNGEYPVAGSWTRRMRPDFTFSFWPRAFSEDEAEDLELITHVHFDAKYRVENIVDLFGADTDEELSLEKRSLQSGHAPRRSDLMKMHAYRDAIRRSEGAYVIYPGHDVQTWRGFHEILPGLGAFPLRPDSGAADLGSISDFVKSVADHLGDRATQLEQTRYQSHLAHARPRYPSVYTSIPERQGATGPREVPWDRTVVLLPADDTVVEWTKEHQHTICPVSGLPARLAAGATHVLLYDGAGASKYMCRLDRAGPEIVSRSDLDELGCPGLIGGTHDSYFRWKIEDDLYYTRLSFDLSRSADLKALVDALRPGVISIWDLEQTLLRE